MWVSVKWLHHDFFIHSTDDGCLAGFQFLVLKSSATVNILVHAFWWIFVHISVTYILEYNSGVKGVHIFGLSTVVLRMSHESESRERPVKPLISEKYLEFLIQQVWGGAQEFALRQVPGDAAAAGPGTALWKSLLSRYCQAVFSSICTNYPPSSSVSSTW